jgi:hypothetical protein
LHAEDPITEIEREVVSNVLGNRLKNLDTELHRLQRDGDLGDVSLVIGGQYLAILARPM